MRFFLVVFLTTALGYPSFAQLKFLERFEVKTDLYDPGFEIVQTMDGLVSFRTVAEKGIGFKKNFQYFISDRNLDSQSDLIEFPVKDGFDMLGYDLDEDQLYILFQKGYSSNPDRYILNISLHERQGVEFPAENLLGTELMEFLVVKRKAMFMGSSDGRPVIQLFDLDEKSVQTVQGIYGNDTQILQIRKMPEINAMEVVLARKGKYRTRDISINTYDFSGSLLREIKIDKFGETGQEIMEGLVMPSGQYNQLMIGSFGLERRNSYQGMYLMDINEFGEYDTKFYTLADFPNFYSYLSEKAQERMDRQIQKDIDRDRTPSIKNVYSIREVRDAGDAYYVYFDNYSVSNSRGNLRQGGYYPTTSTRIDGFNRMMGNPAMDPLMMPGRYPMSAYQTEPVYKYHSAHFVKIGKEGHVIWDNASTLNELSTSHPEAFGEIAIVGDDLYHAFIEDYTIKLSFFRGGEKIFEYEDFELKLTDENERISDTNMDSLKLVYWYDQYYLLSGNQRIRYQDGSGRPQTREVFFLSKVLVNGDLYQTEKLPD